MEKITDRLLEKVNAENGRWIAAAIIILIVIALVLFPYIDANVLAHNRLNNRIESLERLSALDRDVISTVPELEAEYVSILGELQLSRQKSISQWSVSQASPTDYWIKFIVSGCIMLIIALAVFLKAKGLVNRVFGFTLCSAAGALWGWASASIPTLINPWVHAIVAAVVLFVLLALLFVKSGKKASGKS